MSWNEPPGDRHWHAGERLSARAEGRLEGLNVCGDGFGSAPAPWRCVEGAGFRGRRRTKQCKERIQ